MERTRARWWHFFVGQSWRRCFELLDETRPRCFTTARDPERVPPGARSTVVKREGPSANVPPPIWRNRETLDFVVRGKKKQKKNLFLIAMGENAPITPFKGTIILLFLICIATGIFRTMKNLQRINSLIIIYNITASMTLLENVIT